MRLTPRGVALAELLVAALLGTAVLALSLATLMGLQRAVQRVHEHAAARAAIQVAAQLLRSELGDMDPDAGDLLVLEPARLVYRAGRAMGVLCGLAVDGVVVESATYRGLRLPAPVRDSALLLPADDPAAWIRLPVIGPPREEPCAGGQRGLVVPLPAGTPLRATGVLRLYEVIETRFYASGGAWWLGLRSVSGNETIQPISGPFRSGTFGFTYEDGNGMPTAGLLDTRMLEVRGVVLAGLDQALGGAARSGPTPVADSLRFRVYLGGGAAP